MVVTPAVVKPCSNVTVTVTVHNSGDMDGSEVVQLYAEWSDVTRDSPNDSPTADITLVNFERVFVKMGESVTVSLVVDPRHYAVLQTQPLGPPTTREPNGSWVPPAWVMKPATVTLHVGGQQPRASPRLDSNVLTGTVKVDGDGTNVARCPKYIPY
jgi:hypothetical protein